MNAEVPEFISENEIEEYLPHRGKMLLLSRIVSYDMEKHIITGEYDITKECIFYEKEGDGIPSWVSFELMAQTVCALTGIAHKLFGRKILPGMILSWRGIGSMTELPREIARTVRRWREQAASKRS